MVGKVHYLGHQLHPFLQTTNACRKKQANIAEDFLKLLDMIIIT